MGASDKFVGLDGYPGGWVAVWLCGHHQKIEYLENVGRLIGRDFKTAMIDMPIGLPDQGYRECDQLARRMLEKDRSRVFLGARRPLLKFQRHFEANAKAKTLDGKGVSV